MSSFFKTSDGVRLHYLEAGTGPAILFISGFMAPAAIWQPQLEHFAKKHRVVALDPRSHGESEKPTEGHYPSRMARDVHEAIEARKLKPVLVVAWAFACSQMLEYVRLLGTDGLLGLVLVDGYVGRDPTFEQVMGYLQWAQSMQEDRDKHARKFVQSWFVQPHEDGYLDWLTRASMKCPTNSAVALLASWETLENQSPILSKIDIPLMYVAIEAKRDQAQVVQQRASTARIEFVERAGHALFVDQPDKFNDLLAGFIKDTASAQRNRPRPVDEGRTP
jgi:microsomal epoxide hydrolase